MNPANADDPWSLRAMALNNVNLNAAADRFRDLTETTTQLKALIVDSQATVKLQTPQLKEAGRNVNSLQKRRDGFLKHFEGRTVVVNEDADLDVLIDERLNLSVVIITDTPAINERARANGLNSTLRANQQLLREEGKES